MGRGLYEIVGWSFADPGLLDRLRLPADHPMRRVVALENPLSEEQSIMRPTLIGSLLDAARYNAAATGPTSRCSSPAPCTAERRRAGGPAAGRRTPRDRRAPERRAGPRAVARRARAARTSSPPRRCSRRCSSACTCAGRRSPRGVAVPAPRPQRRGACVAPAAAAGEAPASRCGSAARRAAPARGERVGPRAHRGVRDRRSASSRRRRPRWSPSGRSAPTRRCARTSR